jgi:hypothetical protein
MWRCFVLESTWAVFLWRVHLTPLMNCKSSQLVAKMEGPSDSSHELQEFSTPCKEIILHNLSLSPEDLQFKEPYVTSDCTFAEG